MAGTKEVLAVSRQVMGKLQNCKLYFPSKTCAANLQQINSDLSRLPDAGCS